MAKPDWKISGEYLESCNCDYLCPCIFTNSEGRVTHDHCTALLVFRIDEGHSAGVDLAGLSFALVIRSGKVMSDGGWVFGVVVDEAGNEVQRRALAAIAGGEAGGPPGMIRDNLVADFRGVEVRPIRVTLDGHKRVASIPGLLDFAIEAVLSNVGNDQPLYIDNVPHPANTRLALARASAMHLHGFDLETDLDGQGNNGHFAPFSWAA